jgi:hypothetical protein
VFGHSRAGRQRGCRATAAFSLPLDRLLESQYESGIGEMWRALRADVQ